MHHCPHPDCSWQAIVASADGAQRAYLQHLVEEHAGADNARDVDWFEQSPGEISGRRSHEREHVFIVLDGEIVIHTEDDSIELSTGDSVPVEAGMRYHSENLGSRSCVGIRASAPGAGHASGSQ
jgi:mannose-6-phosphate isomerase-like protein (cupin superfamily)